MRRIFFLLISVVTLLISSWAQAQALAGSLVKVQSSILDIGTGAVKDISGVGFLVQSRERQFILTAGHVAKGLDLKLTTTQNEQVNIVKVRHADLYDVSVIEVDTSHLRFPLKPLAYHTKQDGHSLLMTSLEYRYAKQNRFFGKFIFADKDSQMRYRAVPLEGIGDILEIFQELGVEVTDVAPRMVPAAVVVAPWLKFGPEAPVLIQKDMYIRRDPKVESGFVRVRFQPGLSGSPIAIPIVDSAKQSVYHVIGGLLVASMLESAELQGSYFAGWASLTKALDNFDKEDSKFETKSVWALAGKIFLRLSRDRIESFLISGPVGNGEVVDGDKAPEVLQTKQQQASAQVLQQLKNLGYTARQLETLEKIIENNRKFQQAQKTKEQLENEQAARDYIQQISNYSLKNGLSFEYK